MRKKYLLLVCMFFVCGMQAMAQDFENATDAVKNMGVGWNLGNTLDANDATKTWTTTEQHETCWGQPVTKPELLKMMKDAGFGAIRVPVTWYQEMDSNGKVNAAWMARVKEVVDYVINNGMYCILNVHHDTGPGGGAWIKASTDNYNSNKEKYEYLWKQIAETFKNYDQHLLFEAYNEMLDPYNSWCFASFATSAKYDAQVAASAYEGINSYAQSFVTTVRATGGNNTNRNLVVNTYAACSGGGTWNTHLNDPLTEMKLPSDQVENHLIFQVHSYPGLKKNNLDAIKKEVTEMMSGLKTILAAKGAPVIIGEWGTQDDDSNENYNNNNSNYREFCTHFVQEAQKNGIATFYWMGLSDGAFRAQLLFNQPDLAETIVRAYHGNSDSFKYPSPQDGSDFLCYEGEKELSWGSGISISGAAFSAFDKTVKLFLTFKKTAASGSDIQLYYGDWSVKPSFYVDGESHNADYNPGGTVGASQTVSISFSEAVYKNITQKGLIIHGSGVTINKAILKSGTTGISNTIYTQSDNQQIYNLQGQRIDKPSKGIYIRGGKKYIAK